MSDDIPRTRVLVIVLDGLDWQHANGAGRESFAPLWDLVGLGRHRDLAHTVDDADLPPGGIHRQPNGDIVLRTDRPEKAGCAARLEACAEPITPTAVCALLSGTDARAGWFSPDRFATSQELIRTRPWFGVLPQYDMTIGLCNVPLTWPAFVMPRGSWVVSGFPVDRVTLADAGRPWRMPPGIANIGTYPIEAVCCDNGPGGSKDLAAIRASELKIAEWFLKAPRRDVEFLWLRSTDSAGHHAWGTPEYEETVAHATALAARVIREVAPTDAALVISDHGFSAIGDPRCGPYLATSHGPAALKAGLPGAHTMDGILFAVGSKIHQRGILPDQKLDDVAGGILDLLQIPPPPGMRTGDPAWSSPVGRAEAERIRASLAELGYDPG